MPFTDDSRLIPGLFKKLRKGHAPLGQGIKQGSDTVCMRILTGEYGCPAGRTHRIGAEAAGQPGSLFPILSMFGVCITPASLEPYRLMAFDA